MKQLKLLLIFAMILISITSVNATLLSGDSIVITLKNNSLNDLRLETNWTETTAHIDFALDKSTVGYNANCSDNFEGSGFSSCFTTNAVNNVVSTNYRVSGAKAGKLVESGGDNADLIYDPSTTTENFTLEVWMLDYFEAGTDLTFRCGERSGGTPRNGWYLASSGTGWQWETPTTVASTPRANDKSWKWIKISTNESKVYLRGNDTEETQSVDQFTTGYTNTAFCQGSSGTINYIDDFFAYSTFSGAINTSKNRWQLIPYTFATSFSQVNFKFQTDVAGSDISLNFSCNNGTNWASVATNNTATSCPSSQTSNNLLVRIMHNTASAEGYFYNITTSVASVPDTTPPAITLINSTSEGGLGYDIFTDGVSNNKQSGTIARTNDTTPTFFVKTDESATCCVIDNNADLNWTNCYAGTANLDSGAPATTHTLTLNDTNSTGRAGLHNFSIGCKDSVGNENITSTSGKFLVNITDNGAPNITIYTPANKTIYQVGVNFTLDSTIVQHNWSAIDNIDSLLTNCSLFINGLLKHNVTNYANGTRVSSNITYSSTGTDIPWYVNCTDTFGNRNQSEFRVITINSQIYQGNLTLFLNGSNESRSYEFNTTLLDKDFGVNLTATILPNNTFCLDFDYFICWKNLTGNSTILINITELNITRFNGKVESVNLTGKTSVNITIDNNTDIMRVAFKIRGYPVSGSFPNNTIIDVDKDNKSDIVIPGIIQENVIEINEFIVSGSSKRASNLTYITAGSKTININASSIFDVNNFSMQLSSYSLDAENVFSYTEHFNGTDGIKGFNETLSYQSDAPLGILDEFIANNSKWTFSITDTNDDNNNQGLISYGGGGLAINLIDDGEITPHSNSVYTNYDDEAGDLRNSSLVEIISSYYIDSPQIGGFARIRLYATDGTSRIELFEKEVENTLSFDVINITVKKTSSDYKTWQIFQNLSNLGNKDISSLNFNNQIKLEFFNEVIFNNQYPFISRWNLSEIKWSGAWINRSTINGTYKPSGNITSNILIYTATNVSRAILSWSVYEPLGTKILGYISNTCNATNPRFQSVSNEINSVFDTTGNAVCYRFNLNSSINTTSPIIRKVTFDITSGAIRNVTIDCGADGDNDWNFLNELNSTTSPRIVNCSMGEFSAYKTANCLNTKLCQYPISLSTKSGGLLSIDNINITQSLDEIVLSNLTRLETQTEWSFNYSFLNGLLNIYDLDIEFKGSKNFTLYAYSQSNTSYLQGTANLTLRVYYSKFNATFPKGMNEMQLIYPEFFNLNQSNISVYGQTLRYCNSSVDAKCAHFSTPIFNITNLAYDLPSDVYLYANNTINTIKIKLLKFSFSFLSPVFIVEIIPSFFCGVFPKYYSLRLSE